MGESILSTWLFWLRIGSKGFCGCERNNKSPGCGRGFFSMGTGSILFDVHSFGEGIHVVGPLLGFEEVDFVLLY